MAKNKKNKQNGVHGKLFINYNGSTLICRGRLEFLKAVHRHGSISEAAREMGYSYRKAWSLAKKTNEAAGCEIICTSSGGSSGGGASLTPAGEKLIELFEKFLDQNFQLTKGMWDEFKEEFPD
ncbi:MAG: winged helix-turn-helix domain-containing protein [Vulcanimicrobiota bacterium]